MEYKNIAPLKGSFMIASILGILISFFYILPRNDTWGFLLCSLFVIMFIASIISMTYGPDEAMLHRGHEIERKRNKKSQ